MTAFESLSKGLEEALAFTNGETASSKLHDVKLPAVDVTHVRQQTGLSQAQFAKSIGVAKGTLLNWEHGRRQPTGPAQVLLALISKKPLSCRIYWVRQCCRKSKYGVLWLA